MRRKPKAVIRRPLYAPVNNTRVTPPFWRITPDKARGRNYEVAKRIIVADDSTTVQRVVKLILSPKGYEVLGCDDGRKALEAVKDGIPNLILADAVMKNMNGLELSAELKKRTKELSSIPVVILVNSFDDIKDESIRKSGAVARLMKPFDDTQLLNVVEKYASKAVHMEDTAVSEKHEWDMESFERPEVPDFNDPMKTIKEHNGKASANIEVKITDPEPAQQVDDEFFTIPDDEVVKELGVPDVSSYIDSRTNSYPTSEENLSDEEAQRLLEEFRLKEQVDGTIKFNDESQTLIADFSGQARKSPIEKVKPEPDMGLWSGKEVPIQSSAHDFDEDLADIPELEKELTSPAYNPVTSTKEIEKMTKETIEKMVKELLPQIAEKVIREEISKIVGKE